MAFVGKEMVSSFEIEMMTVGGITIIRDNFTVKMFNLKN